MNSCWLIERKEGAIIWYMSGKSFGYGWNWTSKPENAMRFSREVDARTAWGIAQSHVGVGGSFTKETIICEHIFEAA